MHKHEDKHQRMKGGSRSIVKKGGGSFACWELVTEDDTPSSHGSTDTKSHHPPASRRNKSPSWSLAELERRQEIKMEWKQAQVE